MERRRLVYGATMLAMSGVLGLAFFRFTDSRIKAPDESGSDDGSTVVATTASKPTSTSPTPTVVATSTDREGKKPEPEKPKPLPSQVELDVPFVPEAPDGIWTGPWKNACEEASLVMVEAFYRGQTSVATAEAKKRMTELFAIQDRNWGSNANSDAARTAKIANDHMGFKATVVTDPAVEDIKRELAAGRPVISLNHGKELGNPNIPFLATGSFYHMLVIIGYDDATGEFITNDDGDEKAGAGRRYEYAPFMASVHDYIYKTKKTDGPARMIFTEPK